jgi:hypothetical protein
VAHAGKSQYFLECTAQRVRLAAGLTAFVGGFAVSWLAWLYLPGAAFVWVAIVGAAVSFAGIVSALLFVKCPSCALRLVPWAMANQTHTKWLEWLLLSERCPRCGHAPCK